MSELPFAMFTEDEVKALARQYSNSHIRPIQTGDIEIAIHIMQALIINRIENHEQQTESNSDRS